MLSKQVDRVSTELAAKTESAARSDTRLRELEAQLAATKAGALGPPESQRGAALDAALDELQEARAANERHCSRIDELEARLVRSVSASRRGGGGGRWVETLGVLAKDTGAQAQALQAHWRDGMEVGSARADADEPLKASRSSELQARLACLHAASRLVAHPESGGATVGGGEGIEDVVDRLTAELANAWQRADEWYRHWASARSGASGDAELAGAVERLTHDLELAWDRADMWYPGPVPKQMCCPYIYAPDSWHAAPMNRCRQLAWCPYE